MKNLISVLFLFLGLHASCQEWHKDLAEAKKIASSRHQPILLVFQGSDWCAPCIKLDKELWSTDTFKNYAKDHYVMLQADFPRKQKNALSPAQQEKNNTLAARYNNNGIFPYIVMLDNEGNVLGSTSYDHNKQPKDYIALFDSFKS
ncbi:MAG: thiol-disulfide isomerase [Cytophagaceae bacterium]|nr:thiol-disulfide isomerase [Cytophagaceae bacterium]